MGGDIGRNDRRIGWELAAPRLEMREIGLTGAAGGAGSVVLDEGRDLVGERKFGNVPKFFAATQLAYRPRRGQIGLCGSACAERPLALRSTTVVRCLVHRVVGRLAPQAALVRRVGPPGAMEPQLRR